MLRFETKDGAVFEYKRSEKGWAPKELIKDNALEVILVEADAEELWDILRLFQNLPGPVHHPDDFVTISWYGDDARFIAGNINQLL